MYGIRNIHFSQRDGIHFEAISDSGYRLVHIDQSTIVEVWPAFEPMNCIADAVAFIGRNYGSIARMCLHAFSEDPTYPTNVPLLISKRHLEW